MPRIWARPMAESVVYVNWPLSEKEQQSHTPLGNHWQQSRQQGCQMDNLIYHVVHCKTDAKWQHGPLARYVKLRVAHAPGIPGMFSPPPLVSEPDMPHGTCVTHVLWCMPDVSFEVGGGENVPGIPGACTTHNFTYLARGPLLANLRHILFSLSSFINMFTCSFSIVCKWNIDIGM